MGDMASIPEWFGAAVLGAVIAALGYVAKLAVDVWSEWRRAHAARLARLLQLASLLHASRTVFRTQRRLVSRLEDSLRAGDASMERDESGFERHFTRAYARFSTDEAELHALIRSMTIHALRPLDQAIGEWLQSDLTYRTARGATGNHGLLAERLNQLDTHVRLWLAKYEAWIPEHPQHALVYLADEQEHGIGFPPGLDEVVDDVLKEMDARLAPDPMRQVAVTET